MCDRDHATHGPRIFVAPACKPAHGPPPSVAADLEPQPTLGYLGDTAPLISSALHGRFDRPSRLLAELGHGSHN